MTPHVECGITMPQKSGDTSPHSISVLSVVPLFGD
jgi:hypothetical protein